MPPPASNNVGSRISALQHRQRVVSSFTGVRIVNELGPNHAIVGEARASIPRVARLYALCCVTPVVLVNTARETFLHNNARLCIAAPVDKLQQAQARLYFVLLTAYGYPAGVMALIARLTRLSPSNVAVPPFYTSRSTMRARISAVIC